MFKAKQAAIEQFVQTNSPVPVIYENTKSPNPEGNITEWIRVAVMFGESVRRTIGAKGNNQANYRHPGLLIIQIFVREGIGIDRGVEIADVLRLLLVDTVISAVQMLTPSIVKVPISEAGWHQLQVATPFYFDEVI